MTKLHKAVPIGYIQRKTYIPLPYMRWCTQVVRQWNNIHCPALTQWQSARLQFGSCGENSPYISAQAPRCPRFESGRRDLKQFPEPKTSTGTFIYKKSIYVLLAMRVEKQQQKALKCPDSVEAYHGALSRLRLGFESRSGRFQLKLGYYQSGENLFLDIFDLVIFEYTLYCSIHRLRGFCLSCLIHSILSSYNLWYSSPVGLSSLFKHSWITLNTT